MDTVRLLVPLVLYQLSYETNLEGVRIFHTHGAQGFVTSMHPFESH